MNMALKTSLLVGPAALLALTTTQVQEVKPLETAAVAVDVLAGQEIEISTPSVLTMGELLTLSKGQFLKANSNDNGALSEYKFVNIFISLRTIHNEKYKFLTVKVMPEPRGQIAEPSQVLAGQVPVGQEFTELAAQENSVAEDKVVAAVIASVQRQTQITMIPLRPMSWPVVIIEGSLRAWQTDHGELIFT